MGPQTLSKKAPHFDIPEMMIFSFPIGMSPCDYKLTIWFHLHIPNSSLGFQKKN